jgi:outer membrane protein TolC
MISLRIFAALCLLFLATVPMGALAQVEKPACSTTPCSLDEAIELAVSTHPLMAAARAGLSSFEAKVKATKLAWIPTFKGRGMFSGTPAKTGNAVTGITEYGIENWGPVVRLEFSGTMPIYGFGRLGLLKDMAKLGLNVGDAQMQMARSQLEILVVQAYFGLQLSVQLEELLSEGEDYLGRARKTLEALRDEDSDDYDDVDMLRLKIYESEVGTFRIDAARTAELALSGLEKLTGLPAAAFSPPARLALLEAKLGSRDEYLATAFRRRGEMRALGGALSAQEIKVKYEKRGFLPVFFIAAFYTYGRAWVVEEQGSPFAYDPYNSWFSGAALGVEYKLDTARQVLALDEARAEERKLKAQRAALRQQVAMEVEQAWAEVRDLAEKLSFARKAHKAARGWVIAQLDLYESGLVPFKDTADALTAFFKQRMAYAQARFDYNVGLARLAHASGMHLSELTGSE